LTGIELRGRERKSRGIDYNAEVAFEKKPAPGFYDTGAENAMTKDMQQEFRPTTVEEMEGKRRKVGCPVASTLHHLLSPSLLYASAIVASLVGVAFARAS
jgi:hypothetical protein